jgi:hypothetical protein
MQTPLRTTFYRSHSPFELVRTGDCLVITYHRVVRVVAWILCFLGWPVLILGMLGLVTFFTEPSAANLVGTVLFLLWGGVIGFMGVWLLGPRYRFDMSVRQLTIRHCWRTRRLPLRDIVAVQVIDAGMFESGMAEHGGGPLVVFSSHQLNLVLDRPDERRLFVAYNDDVTDVARKAKILAEFLHVPLAASPKFMAVVESYGRHDSLSAKDEPDSARFRGSDTLRRCRDRRLPEPYRSWIDKAQPLPALVRLLPRAVNIVFDLGIFIILGTMFLGMAALVTMMFGPMVLRDFADGNWGGVAILAVIDLMLAILPFVLLRRLCITVAAWCDLRRGRLRQGILVGPAGVLVRMEPNRCYPIALDRFVSAKLKDSGVSTRSILFVVETLDGVVDFFGERINAHPEELNRCVAELRSKKG